MTDNEVTRICEHNQFLATRTHKLLLEEILKNAMYGSDQSNAPAGLLLGNDRE